MKISVVPENGSSPELSRRRNDVVPTAMIRFNNEWHGTSSTPSNFIRTQLYLRSWFDTYQTPPKGQRVTPNQQ